MDLGNFRKNTTDEDETWAEWLRQDEPEQPKARPKPSVGSMVDFAGAKHKQTTPGSATTRKPQKRSKSQGDDEAAISIEIRMPHVRLPRPKIPWRRLRPWFIGAAVVFVLLVGGKFLVDKVSHRTAPKDTTPTSATAAVDLGYKPVVPSPRPEDAEQPSKPLYDSQKRLYYYSDKFKDVDVYVSQQAIPDNLKDNADEVKKYAATIGATDSFTTTLGTVYIATSQNGSSQWLMLANDKMLMFIQSSAKLETTDWVEYIQDLQ